MNTSISKHVRNCEVLALLVGIGACASEPDPGDGDGSGGTGGEVDSKSSGGSMAAVGGSANPSGGADASGGGSPAPSGGAETAGGGVPTSDGGAPAGSGGDAPGGLGGEGGAVGGSAADGGSGGVTDGSGGASDGGGGTSTGGQPAVNLCLTFVTRTDENADRQITWNFGIDIDEERCLEIRVGQSVTWNGNFSLHPLAANGGTIPSPILSRDEGSGPYPVQFTAEGTFGFICESHVEMRGAVRVVP